MNDIDTEIDVCSTKIFYFALFSVSAMTVLGSTVIAPSLPNMENHFSYIKNIETIGKLILTLPALFIVFFSPIAGFLFDKFERLKLIYPAMILWSISGVIGFFLDNIYYILISRAIFGISTAFVMTGSSALIVDYYKGIKREKALGVQGFYAAFGGALFLIIGGFLSNINWRYPFLVYLIGFLIFFIAYRTLFEPKRQIITTPIINKNEKFDFFEFSPVYFISFVGMTLFYITPTQIPFLIIEVLKKGGELVGILLAISSVFTAISSIMYQKLRSRFNLDNMYVLGFLLISLGFCLISIFHNYLILLFSLAVIGSALGIFLVTNSSRLFLLASDNVRAKAYGFLVSSVFMGQFLSPIITQPIVNIVGLVNMFLVFGLISLLFAIWYIIKSFKQKSIKYKLSQA